MNKLKEEELLIMLGMAVQNSIEYFVINKDKEFMAKIPKLQQAHLQIKEMIQKPGVTKEWIEEKMIEFFREKYPTFPLGSDNLHITSFVREFGIWLVEEMPVKKPTVAKAFVEKWNQIIAERVNVQMKKDFIREEISLVYPGTDNLIQMLKEAGVEEEKAKEKYDKGFAGYDDKHRILK